MEAQIIATALAMAAIVGFWLLVPTCPECGCVLTTRDDIDARLRHCRRCFAIVRLENRR
jgi:hypothetical protein